MIILNNRCSNLSNEPLSRQRLIVRDPAMPAAGKQQKSDRE